MGAVYRLSTGERVAVKRARKNVVRRQQPDEAALFRESFYRLCDTVAALKVELLRLAGDGRPRLVQRK
jgi:hypothetical protein